MKDKGATFRGAALKLCKLFIEVYQGARFGVSGAEGVAFGLRGGGSFCSVWAHLTVSSLHIA